MLNSNIIQSCINKERWAQKQCYESCAPYAFTIVKNYINDHELRKDTMQEVFANLFMSLKNFDSNKGAFKSWFAKIVINQCIAALRKTSNLNLHVPVTDYEEKLSFQLSELSSIKREEVEVLLKKMPDGYRTVFLLSVLDDYNHKEIAKMLSITPETSRSQLSRATKWIRQNISTEAKTMIYG